VYSVVDLQVNTAVLMPEVSALLRVLSKRVYTATVDGVSVRDVSDVAEWLRRLADRAGVVGTMGELFGEEV
jgi:hypothetical protein